MVPEFSSLLDAVVAGASRVTVASDLWRGI
jgi:hypothetical protein